MVAGKVVVVAGYGDVGKGCAQSLRGLGARVIITEIDPISALQAAMEGYEVTTMEEAAAARRHLRHRHRLLRRHPGEHMKAMKNDAIVCNIGHFDSEIDIAWLEKNPEIKEENIKPQVDQFIFPDGKRIIVLAARPPGEPRLRDRPPVVRDERTRSRTRCSRRSRCGPRPSKYEMGVYVLPKKLDEKVARAAPRQARREAREADARTRPSYLGVPVDGPYKPEHYRY